LGEAYQPGDVTLSTQLLFPQTVSFSKLLKSWLSFLALIRSWALECATNKNAADNNAVEASFFRIVLMMA